MLDRKREIWLLIGLLLLLAACSGADEPAVPETAVTETAEPVAEATEPPPTEEPPPTPTPEPPTATPPAAETATPEPEPTEEATATAPADTPTPEIIIADAPIPIGSIADWTSSADINGIEGIVEVTGVDEIVIQDFVSFVAPAPGVDIRLGMGRDFSDEASVVLRDITGKEYDGRTLTLTIPSAAFAGRSFNSIAVFCYETGEIFDYAEFAPPAP